MKQSLFDVDFVPNLSLVASQANSRKTYSSTYFYVQMYVYSIFRWECATKDLAKADFLIQMV